MKKVFLLIFSLILFSSLSFSTEVSAASKGLGGALGNLRAVGSGTGLQSDLTGTVAMIIKVILSLTGTIFLILMVYAGFTWMMAGGDENKIKTAKSIIKASIIGLIIVLSAYAITTFVVGGLSKETTGSSEVSGGVSVDYCCCDKTKHFCVGTDRNDCDTLSSLSEGDYFNWEKESTCAITK